MPSSKRVSSAVYAVFTLLASAFIVSSAAQIAWPLFFSGASTASSERARPTVAPACAEGVRRLAAAVDRAVAAAAGAADRGEAERRYAAAKNPEWQEANRAELVQPCSSDPRGGDAVAAVTRLDRAAAGAIRHQTEELGPVRRAVESFIR